MKKTVKFLWVLLIAVVGLVSCTKTGNGLRSIEDLKPVVYNQEATKELSAVKTGRVVQDPTTGDNKNEYLVTVQKQYLIRPMSVVKDNEGDIIYPGSIIRGDSFMQGIYNPLVLENDFEPVSLSMSLRGNINVSTEIEPKLSKVRSAMNDLLAQQKDKIDLNYVPTIWSYESHEITTEESIKQSLKIHATVKVLSGIAKADFDYQQSKNSSSKQKYVMVSFRQTLFNFAIDPKHYSQWIKGKMIIRIYT